jgi:DNA-binding NtrC family response regulator
MEDRLDTTIRVLVVDDEKDIRDGCERILRRMGCEVLKTSRGDEAIHILKSSEQPVSIVLLDLKMPGMDGMEVLAHIRETDPNILVIIISGFSTIETAVKAIKQGAYHFIPKPFEPDHMRRIVGRACETLWEQKKRVDIDTEENCMRPPMRSVSNGVLPNASG